MAGDPQSNTVNLTIGGIYPMLVVILFLISSISGSMVLLSPDALLQPYTGAMATASIILAILAFADIFVYYFMFYKKYINEQKSHMILLVYPDVIAVFGFIIGILNHNPWAAMPFVATGFAIYAFVYLKISGQQA